MKDQTTCLRTHPDFRINYEQALNPSQLEAVTFMDGPLLVIAGAGSGKTRTLTYRVAHLVERGVPPGAVLLLTFTRKAAQGMLRRAAALLDNRCENIAGGTFHSFANALLRRYGSHTGLAANFTILDRSDTESLIGLLKKDLGFSLKNRSFPKNRTLANIFSKTINKASSVQDLLYNDYPHLMPELDDIMAIYSAYNGHKLQHGCLDFDDLLVYLHRLLQDVPDIRRRISSTSRYIMVDEYQDTNPIQAEILELLSDAHRNIMVVGDDSQSIYAFRGANFKNIMDFPKIFPGTRIIRLEENYRSVQPILNLANHTIEMATEKYTKTLFSRKPGDKKPELVSAAGERSQSKYIIEKILRLSAKGIPLSQIAVLFRAGFHSFDLEVELARNRIPFIKMGGFKFVESAHIKDVLAHLRVLSNPYDRISWHRILLQLDKIGPKTADKIYRDILNQNEGCAGLLKVKARSAHSSGMDSLQALFAQLLSMPRPLVEMGEAVLAYYLPILKAKHDDHPKRTRDIEQLLAIMEKYDTLDAFLSDMALEPPSASVDNSLSVSETSGESRLTLSTIHSAKGLEWHTVFIIWVLDGRFPPLHSMKKHEELEEELRLMYVAMTRAQELLYLTLPMQIYDRSAGKILNRPSRFVELIPDTILTRRYYY
ncbi:MAG: ATP-dependent helicase [Desulfobacterales bacterium]|nr:ATP-dependent helicase [Desulfobacterales bacterium]